MQAKNLPLHPKAHILFENENFFVLDKPAGVLSHPNSKENTKSSVIQALYDSNGEYYLMDDEKVFLIHRIDKETSGCLLFAKQSSLAKKIKNDFLQHLVHKEYTALTAGVLRGSVTWKDHLVKKDGTVKFDPRKKPNAVTKISVIQVFEKSRMSLLKMEPESGKTHQLRVQSSKRNLHIIGDRQYGHFAKNKEFKKISGSTRMFLHATSLRFKDAGNGAQIHVQSQLPQDFEDALVSLS